MERSVNEHVGNKPDDVRNREKVDEKRKLRGEDVVTRMDHEREDGREDEGIDGGEGRKEEGREGIEGDGENPMTISVKKKEETQKWKKSAKFGETGTSRSRLENNTTEEEEENSDDEKDRNGISVEIIKDGGLKLDDAQIDALTDVDSDRKLQVNGFTVLNDESLMTFIN